MAPTSAGTRCSPWKKTRPSTPYPGGPRGPAPAICASPESDSPTWARIRSITGDARDWARRTEDGIVRGGQTQF
jgi:hypothetical protein